MFAVRQRPLVGTFNLRGAKEEIRRMRGKILYTKEDEFGGRWGVMRDCSADHDWETLQQVNCEYPQRRSWHTVLYLFPGLFINSSNKTPQKKYNCMCRYNHIESKLKKTGRMRWLLFISPLFVQDARVWLMIKIMWLIFLSLKKDLCPPSD